MTKTKEWIYQWNQRFQAKCPCLVCRAKMRLMDFADMIDDFYIWLRYMKWIAVEYRGSDYSDFREYKVIAKGRIRIPDGKGMKWPKSNYKHNRIIEIVGQ